MPGRCGAQDPIPAEMLVLGVFEVGGHPQSGEKGNENLCVNDGNPLPLEPQEAGDYTETGE